MQDQLKSVEKVEIITLEDNYIDLVSMDNSEIVSRAMPLKGTEISNSILAEHGFSCIIRTLYGGETRSMIFDFGLSEDVAARNADAINADLSQIDAAALSHGHMDHFGGMGQVAEKIGKKGLELVLHPGVFKKNRHVEPVPGFKVTMPAFTQEMAAKAGFELHPSEGPKAMLDNTLLFLGGIPRLTDFEKGMPNAFYELEEGDPQPDHIEDDTALVVNLKDKCLVIISGCAHSGIINTVNYSKKVAAEDKVHVVMGGFHLSGPAFEPVIEPTIAAMKDISPNYIIPTHCTGRKAVEAFEKAFPGRFILNMAGTTLTFR